MRPASGQWWMSLVALAFFGLGATLPLHAQDTRSHTRILLSTLKMHPVVGAGNLSYGKVADYGLFIFAGQSIDRPACVILINPDRERMNARALEGVAKRFLRAYKLHGYKVITTKNGSAALLCDEQRQQSWRNRWQQAATALSQDQSAAPIIDWLNVACGGAPHRYDNGKLYWRKKVRAGNTSRDMEVVLNMLDAAPCCIDLRARGVSQSAIADVVEESLRMRFSEVNNQRAAFLRRKLGAKPLAVMGGSDVQDSICLMRPDGESGRYRIGDYDALLKHRQRGDHDEEQELPEPEQSRWADEMDIKLPSEQPQNNSTQGQSLMGSLQNTTNNTPQPSGGNNTTQPQPAQPGSPTGDDNAMPTPAEAREAFLQRLRAL